MRIWGVLLFFFFFQISWSQNEASNWFFGQGLGLSFFGNSKPIVQSGNLNTLEGCASISDSNGNLLFYSDGSTVWNRNHGVMPNGSDLLGDESSSQSAIIVPNPKNTNIYYLFTVGSTVNPSGYHYYTIDMNLDGGRGDISAGPVDLTGDKDGEFWSEKITAVETDTCDSYWVISIVDDEFYAYLVDENGVSSSPKISKVDFMSRSSRGYLKISPNGSKIAAAHQGRSQSFIALILYSFNNETGEVSNDGITLFGPGVTNGIEAPYGVEFSPNTTKLYASTILGREYKLYQWDLESEDISSTRVLIHEESNAYRGALQLGIDQKIYVTIPEEYEVGTNFLDVINNPEEKGLACDFEQDYINFGSGVVMQGLPPFIQSLFIVDEINIVNPYEPVTEVSKDLELCFNSSYTLAAPEIAGANYEWEFIDNGVSSPIATPNPAHLLTINGSDTNTSGTYKVRVETFDDCDRVLVGEAEVSFTKAPALNDNVTLSGCDLFDTDATDGLTTFDLSLSLDDITFNNASNFTAYFYKNSTDAEADTFNQNSLPVSFQNTIQNQSLTAKVFENGSECYSLITLNLEVNTSINLNAPITYGCDSGNNTALFNLEEQRNEIKSLNSLPAHFEIDFYENIVDALTKENELPNAYESATDNIYFYVTDNGVCYGSGQLELTVSSFPDIPEFQSIILCEDAFPVILDPQIPSEMILNYNYFWSTTDANPTLEIFSEQTITLTIQDKVSLCEFQQTFEIVQSEPPAILDVEIDFDNNAIEVITEENEDNLYTIDDPYGTYQTSNIFNEIYPGTYEVFVLNQYNCGITSQTVYVFGFPKFFTPNQDGYNDTWQVLGADLSLFDFSPIEIFDRYGKHLTTLEVDESWDGVYNSATLPSTDYWFKVSITEKATNTITNYQGHFSLIRR